MSEFPVYEIRGQMVFESEWFSERSEAQITLLRAALTEAYNVPHNHEMASQAEHIRKMQAIIRLALDATSTGLNES